MGLPRLQLPVPLLTTTWASLEGASRSARTSTRTNKPLARAAFARGEVLAGASQCGTNDDAGDADERIAHVRMLFAADTPRTRHAEVSPIAASGRLATETPHFSVEHAAGRASALPPLFRVRSK